MKKVNCLLASATLALAGAGMMNSAVAADGTITFTGRITSQTCTINDGRPDFSVLLPTVSVQTLNASGTTAGRTPFRINLTNCDEDLEEVAVYFEPGANTSLYDNRLINTGTATNVELQLLNDNLTPLKLSEGVDAQGVKFIPVKNRAATLTYFAEYYAIGSTGAGTVESSTQYTVVYP